MKLVALGTVRTREVVQPPDPMHGRPLSVTKQHQHAPSTDPSNPTVFEVKDEKEAEELIRLGVARKQADHEKIVEDERKAAESPLVPVAANTAPRGAASGDTTAPDPNIVGERAALARYAWESGGDAGKASSLEAKHSVTVDRSTSPRELVEEDDKNAEHRRGRQGRGR